MESAAVLQSFQCSATITSHARSHGLPVGQKLFSSCIPRRGMLVSCAKTSETIAVASSQGSPSLEKQSQQRTIFPNGFEVGDFEMHLKRKIEVAQAPTPVVPASVPSPPAPTKQVESPSLAAVSSPPKSSPASPFVNVSQKASMLAALEASGATNYVVVTSTEVGTFRRGRTVKGKKQPPSCKPGDLIKEGQVIGFLDRFGIELPLKSDASGEVLKVLFEDGEPVGYGDPLIAVLPSSHRIKPVMLWLLNYTGEKDTVCEMRNFVAVLIPGFLGEIIGQHYVLGPSIM
ncbi:Biotin/lipoyl attachment, partial [Dillenia turbinata]